MNTIRALAHTSLFALTLIGCATQTSGGDNSVRGRVVTIDRTTQDLLAADLLSVNGSYGASCTNRAGNWSLEIAAAAVLDHDVLSVVRNDTDCTLTLTELRTSTGLMEATPSFALGTTFQVAASAMGTPVSFYANAELDSISFATDFVLTVLYSDDPELASGDHTAEFTFQTASVDAESVPAPDNTLDLTGLVVQTDVDDVVQAVGGSAALTAGSVAGTEYVVVVDAGLSAYSDIDAAYLGETSTAFSGSVPASAFDLVGEDLSATQLRTLIIANIVEGVRAYQTFEITFNAPVRSP